MKIIHWMMVWMTVFHLKEVKTDSCSYVEEIGDMYCKDVSIGILRNGYYPINITNTSKLKRLNLVSSNLSSVESVAFWSLHNLVYLDMNENKIEILHEHLFNTTPELRQLFIARNQIKTLHRMLFRPMHHLTHLDISGNPLSSLADTQIFVSQNSLLYLSADNVKLKKISTDLFEPLTSLRTLGLNDNEIQCKCNLWNTTAWFKGRCFSLSMNCKGQKGVKHTSLESYYENRCGPNRRLKYRKVEIASRFDIDYNYRRTHRRPYPGGGYNFDDFDDWPRHHSRYPGTHKETRDEEYIYDDTDTNETLSFGNISTACPKKTCRFSKSLDRMDCEGNDLKRFGKNNYPFTERGFSELILDNNKLEKLEGNAFDEISEILSLSLRKNGLRTLNSDTFQKLTNLIFLDLSDNLLGGLFESKLLSSQRNLRILYINSNGITEIDPEFFKSLSSLKRLFLENNPLDCNCALNTSMLPILQRKVLTKATCRYPVEYSGKSWKILQSATYCRLPAVFKGYTPASEVDQVTLTIIFFGIILLICGTVQLIHYMVNKFHKPKPGDVYYIPPDFDLF